MSEKNVKILNKKTIINCREEKGKAGGEGGEGRREEKANGNIKLCKFRRYGRYLL